MDAGRHLLWTLICCGALLAAGCDGNGSDKVPKTAARAQADATAPSNQGGAPQRSDGAAQAQPAESREDAQLSAKVEAAIKSEPDLHGVSIAVRTEQGVVTLSGTTPDPELRNMAAQVALSVEGVKHVRNELQISHRAKATAQPSRLA